MLCNHVLSGLTQKKNVFYSHSLLETEYGTIWDSKRDCFLDLRTAGWGEARVGYRRHNWKLVASEFWTTSVSVRAATHYKTEGTQETISRSAARERYNDKNGKSLIYLTLCGENFSISSISTKLDTREII